MEHHTATPQEFAYFERLAESPKTQEIMDQLSKRLAMDLQIPAKVSMEIAAVRLGLEYQLIDSFRVWWLFDRKSNERSKMSTFLSSPTSRLHIRAHPQK